LPALLVALLLLLVAGAIAARLLTRFIALIRHGDLLIKVELHL
jgi:hypothetical protein